MATFLKNPKGPALCLALFLCPGAAWAALHYLNRGTAYHLGDGRLHTSRDLARVSAHPQIGTLWEQDFTASMDDQVEVVLERLWGVDAAGQRLIEVMVDGRVIGEIEEGEQGPWRSVLKAEVARGRLHTLAVRTRGLPDPDDFVFEGVQVRSYTGARILPQGEPRITTSRVLTPASTPVQAAPIAEEDGVVYRREAPCGVYGAHPGWRPGGKRGNLRLSVGSGRGVESEVLARLPKGYWKDIYFRVQDLAGSEGGRHRMEVKVGQGPRQSWVFEIEPVAAGSSGGQAGPLRASHLWKGDPDPLTLKPGWNQLRVHYCVEGLLWMRVGDKVFTKAARGREKTKDITVHVLDIDLELSNQGDPS